MLNYESLNNTNFQKLSSSSTSSKTNKTVPIVTTHDQYNILPSYQMHQAILSNPPPNPNQVTQELPAYGEVNSPGSHGIVQSMGQEYVGARYGSSHEDLVGTSGETSCSSNSCFSSSYRSNSERSSMYAWSPATEIHNPHDSALNHQLEPLSSRFPSDSISIAVYLTAEACIPGKSPKFLSPEVSNYYTTGDDIHGFVLCENLTSTDLPFSMFHVLLEGNIIRADSMYKTTKTKPHKVINFLQSVDLSASFNYSVEEGLKFDPIDNTQLFFSRGRILEPGVRYKRYFSFKVPQKLIDYHSKEDGLIMQTQLPPSLDPESFETLSFNDNKIEYSIIAKLVGQEVHQNNFFTFKDCSRNVIIIPQTTKEAMNPYHREEAKAITNSIKAEAEYFIKLGKQIRKLMPIEESSKGKLQNGIDRTSFPNSQGNNVTEFMQSPNHLSKLPIRTKKLFGGTSNELGLLDVFVSTIHKEVKFIAPIGLRKTEILQKDLDSWKINIPVSLRYLPNSDGKFPEITNISASLECVTYVNDKFKLPIEIDFDYLFNNETGEELPTILIKTFKRLNYDLCEQLREVHNRQDFSVVASLLEDLRAISTIKTKKSTLSIGDITIDSSSKLNSKSLPWKEDREELPSSTENTEYFNEPRRNSKRKDININIDLASAFLRDSMSDASTLRSFDTYNIVPSFQNCFIGRMYCLKLALEFPQGIATTTRIPITITN
ncbi:hypothetical protein CLIB1423_21S01794 [[Candida] railenensis]|uniref:Bul1 N-terminal domain-containing protein n=1 Tax=[Candida] railenensis TaxID=45579 RepID=A0A9P0QUB1_9ASCO|nr:hypothetical protein CLIB1423_21S01794 [[Candida] railenensis]